MGKVKIVGTEQDNKRLLESRYDLRAVSDSAKLTPSAAAQAHVQESAQTLAVSRETLRQAMLTVSRENNETDQARLAAYEIIEEAVVYYEYVRNEAHNRLFNLPSSVRKKLTDAQMQTRERTFQQYLGTAPGDVRAEAPARQLNALTQIADGLAKDELLSAFQLHGELSALIAQSDEANATLDRERAEDSQAVAALVAARAQFEIAASAHTKLIDSILTAQNRLSEWGRFTKAQDPAYAARRRAQTPIADEPDADDLLSDIADDIAEPTTTLPTA